MKKEDSFIRTKNWGNDGDVTYLTFLENGIKREMISTETVAKWQMTFTKYSSLDEIYSDFSNPLLYIKNTKAYDSTLSEVYGYSKIFPLCVTKALNEEMKTVKVIISFIGTDTDNQTSLVKEIITKPNNSFSVIVSTKTLF